MTVSILNLHCLNAVCDDYEGLPTILEEVRRSSHGNVSLEEIAESMSELVRDGFVEAFQFDRSTGHYVRLAVNNVTSGKSREEGMWFLITPKGRSELDANWVDS